jgi:group I intron endonuclease
MFVYKISNSINDKVYIGITSCSIEQRYKWHVRDCKKGVEKKLYKAMIKHGIDNFKIELLEYADNAIIDKREEFYIEHYDSFNNGYNASPVSNGIRHHTEKTKKLMSEKAKGRKQSKDTLEKRSIAMKDFWKDNAELKKQYTQQAQINFGNREYTQTKEFRENARQRMLGTTRSEETKQKISKANRNKPQPTHICPHCKKEGKSNAMIRWHFDNCKEKT